MLLPSSETGTSGFTITLQCVKAKWLRGIMLLNFLEHMTEVIQLDVLL